MNAKKLQPPPEWRVSVEDWVKSLIASGYSEDTVRCRRYKLTHAAIGLGRSPVDVTTGDLVCWMAGQHWKPETLKAYRNTLTSFFGRLQRTGARPDNPAADLPKVKRPKAHPRPCPDKHILAALAKANETETLMLRLAAECGLRRGEIAGVNSRDVMDDLLGKSLIVRGKGDKQRIVPLPDDLAEAIESCGGWLFPGRWQGHVEESYVGKHISRLLPEGYGAHSLRHRYATATYAATHDLYLVARLLGHASVETTQIYVAMPDARLRAGMAAVMLGA